MGVAEKATGYTEPWRFANDRPVRNRLFAPEVYSHPAKLHLGLLLKLIELYTLPGETLLDPMAGSGSLLLGAYHLRNVVLRELQPEYVALMHLSEAILRRRAGFLCGQIDIAQGDARQLSTPKFNHAIFSPPYNFEVGTKDSWERRKERLLKVDHDQRWHRKFKNVTTDKFRYAGGNDNIGNKTGQGYWHDMRLIYGRVADLLPAGGRMILIVKNSYRRGKLRDLTGQTITEVEQLGLDLVSRHGRLIDNPSLWQRRRREQGLPIVEVEDVLVFQKVQP